MFYSDCILLKLRCFSVSDNHGKTRDVILHSQHAFQNFRLEVANKKPLSPKPAIARIEISLLKRYSFLQLQNFVVVKTTTRGKCC